jgi:gluconolactonase
MLKKISVVLPLIILFCSSSCTQEVNMKNYKTTGEIHREDSAINDLIPGNAVIEVLAEGFDWSEGPVWVKKDSSLLFTDIPKNSIFKWNEKEGLSLYLRPAGFALGDKQGGDFGSNGLFINPVNDQLVLCDHGNRCITELNRENWSKKIIVDSFEGKRLNSPNDIVINSKGDFYFTDPPYGLPRPDYTGKELDFSGVFHLKTDGSIKLITKELDYPNGIGLSPDEKTLYVANSGERRVIMAFDLAEDGTASNGRIFYDATGFTKYGKGGGCDGMAIDEKGNIWATGPGGVMIFTPEGKFLGSIDTGTALANCKFGGADGKELYITAEKYLCRVKVNVKGAGF